MRRRPAGCRWSTSTRRRSTSTPDVAEKMIRKLRAGMMPPPTVADRPDAATLDGVCRRARGADRPRRRRCIPNPGRRPFQRLNRAEYARRGPRSARRSTSTSTRSCRADTISHGFDNIADVADVLADADRRAICARRARSASVARRRSRRRAPTEATYKVPRTESQMHHVDGAPFGTRGGVSVVHTFPGRRRLHVPHHAALRSPTASAATASTVRGEQIEVSINGERVALLDDQLPDERGRTRTA